MFHPHPTTMTSSSPIPSTVPPPGPPLAPDPEAHFFFIRNLTLFLFLTTFTWPAGWTGGTRSLAAQIPPVSEANGPRALLTGDPLEEAIRDAIRHSQEVAMQRASSAEALQEARMARSALLPTATLESRYTRIRGGIDLGEAVNPAYQALNDLLGTPRFPTDLDLTVPLRHETRLRVVQPLLDRSASARREAAVHRAAGEMVWSRGVSRTVAAEAQRALVLASAAREGRRIREAALARAVEGERVAERQVAEGLATPSALLQARADRRELEADLEEARSREDAARWALNRMTGRKATTSVPDLGGHLLSDARIPQDRPQNHAQHLWGTREELARLDEGIRAAEAGVRAARAGRLPTLVVALDPGFQGSRVRFDSNAWSASASLVVVWPVFTGGRTSAGIEAAQLALHRLRLARDQAEEGLMLEARIAARSLQAAEAALPAASARLEASAEVHALTLRRFEEGLATPFELSVARTGLTAADLGQSLARHERLLAWINLEYAAALRLLPDTP